MFFPKNMGVSTIYALICQIPLQELEFMRDSVIPADRKSNMFPDAAKRMMEDSNLSEKEFYNIKQEALDMAEILIGVRISELKHRK